MIDESQAGAPGAATELLEKSDGESTTGKWFLYVLPCAFVLGVLVILACVTFYGWGEAARAMVELVEQDNHPTHRAFTLLFLQVVITVCCLPGTAFVMILTGFFFGMTKGFVFNLIGDILSYATSLIVGRYLLQGRMRRWLMRIKIMQEAIEVLEDDSGGHFLVLFRFITLPVWVKNYAMAELHISWFRAVLCFLPAALYFVFTFTYMGTKGYTAAQQVKAGEFQAREVFSNLELIMIGVAVFSTVLICILGRQEYQRRRAALSSEG